MTQPPNLDLPPQPQTPPQVQYFLQPGAMLPQRTWQRRSRVGVTAASVIVGLILAGIAGFALLGGSINQAVFTASGSLQIDCSTRQAVGGAPIREGDEVRLYDGKSGELLGKSRLGDQVTVKGGTGACFDRFTISRVVDKAPGYLVEAGTAPGRVYSRAQLEAGIDLAS
ncbi:MAG: hypothetical protein QM774_05420 [Gordonia sp. (in: high G+C Gram-positive bacteria)]|uniref:hypothetical protein n=1 Tax=Gordonia sp. (in: high G+C Gram-positive bacteria) TaxID=84139 RepID=UPI0039E5FA18